MDFKFGVGDKVWVQDNDLHIVREGTITSGEYKERIMENGRSRVEWYYVDYGIEKKIFGHRFQRSGDDFEVKTIYGTEKEALENTPIMKRYREVISS